MKEAATELVARGSRLRNTDLSRLGRRPPLCSLESHAASEMDSDGHGAKASEALPHLPCAHPHMRILFLSNDAQIALALAAQGVGLPHLYKGDTGPKPRPAKAPGSRRGRAGPAGHQQSPRARGCRQSAPSPPSFAPLLSDPQRRHPPPAWGRLVAFGFCSNKLSPLLNMPQFTSKPSCCQRRDPKETAPPASPSSDGE